MEKLKVLVVDDSVVYRKIVCSAVEGTEMATVEQTASNGKLALERIENGKFNVVLMDVNMPEMDGIQALKIIKAKWPDIYVIMISGAGGKNVTTTLRALELGALDFILKPLEEDYEKNMALVRNHLKVLFTQIQIKSLQKRNIETNEAKIPIINQNLKTSISGVDLVLVASSTGGPVALEKLFKGFSKNFYKPILVVQHMPPEFTRVLAENLDKKSDMSFIEGKEGAVVRAGQVIVAPGGSHMILTKVDKAIKQIKLLKSEYVNGVRPAADVLFKSVAEELKGLRVIAVVLTGMGSDGTEGVRALKKNCYCYCITQNEKSCVVYGMPRSVVEAGLSDEVLNLEDISRRISSIAEFGS